LHLFAFTSKSTNKKIFEIYMLKKINN